jgi:hypothetical protein
MPTNQSNHSCDPTDFMSKDDCDRLHKEQREYFTMFMTDSKQDRSDIWNRHNELVTSVNNLIKSAAGTTIRNLIIIIIALAGFIGSNIYFKQTPPSIPKVVLDSIQSSNILMQTLARQNEDFMTRYNEVSGDNNRMLKELERRKKITINRGIDK